MDQSDNVDTTYLLIGTSKLAQNTAANAAASKNNATGELISGRSNDYLTNISSPLQRIRQCSHQRLHRTRNGLHTLHRKFHHCSKWNLRRTGTECESAFISLSPAPNYVYRSQLTAHSQELQSQYFPPAVGPALVPLNDDFAYINNNGVITQSLAKTNLYRAGVGQPQAADTANASGTTYCRQYAASGIFIAENEALFTGTTSPAAAVANNLFTFMANRFATSFGPLPSLGCSTMFGVAVTSIVQQTVDGNGVVTAATINTAILQVSSYFVWSFFGGGGRRQRERGKEGTEREADERHRKFWRDRALRVLRPRLRRWL